MSTVWVLYDYRNPMWSHGKMVNVFATEELAVSAREWYNQNGIYKTDYVEWEVIDYSTPFQKFMDEMVKRDKEEKKIF